ncbi:ribosome assembly RNA-binding protein YhbY [Legionella sp. W05-934-2]|jgi:RNA-binding protein|uniref:ribosome assembly RNA-binding protein YhbY n=1 Tax=Legionella sp. W05-934-2 TaxID=1198649 RepID=UPI003463655A
MKSDFRQQLKARAHSLKPVVLIGDKGLTDAVISEVDHALKAHELIKVKIRGQEKQDRALLAEQICPAVAAELVQHIGNILVLYRQNENDD